MDKQELTLFKLQLRKDLLMVILQSRYNLAAECTFNNTIAEELAALEEMIFKGITPYEK